MTRRLPTMERTKITVYSGMMTFLPGKPPPEAPPPTEIDGGSVDVVQFVSLEKLFSFSNNSNDLYNVIFSALPVSTAGATEVAFDRK
ncbi:unnamed protein product [Allacma fusca]|uniref:Uncharacterized protein n=1 Tax=Allacma fusca TaxID=39272 RepID=A0A8J2KX66_9HEXA|nr:unnamed protein product [Allacma fusca]